MADTELVVKILEEIRLAILIGDLDKILLWMIYKNGTIDKLKCGEVTSVFEDATIIEADTLKRRKGTPLEENDSGYNCENWIP